MTNSAFKFARCMRQHGVSNFPDPQIVDQPGQQVVKIGLPAGLAGSPQLKTAQKACRGILPAPGPNVTDGPSPQQQHARELDILSFARCMRSHGVSNFPDPNAQGQLSIEMVDAAGVDVHAPNVQTVATACLPASHGALTPAALHRAENSAP